MTDFSNSVIMPREDFIELTAVAYDNSHVPTLGERVAQTTQTTAIFGGMTLAVVGASWGWAKAMDWLEERNYKRKIRALEDITVPKQN